MRKFTLPAAALCSLILLASCASSTVPEAATSVSENTQDRKLAPDFTLKDGEGQNVSLSDFRGKVVLLNFWATWCGPCRIEMPWFVEFQRQFKDQGFSVVAVSLDEEGWEVIRPFAEDMKLNFPVLLGNDNLATEFGGVEVLPTTLIIDKEGRIVSTHIGLESKGNYENEIKGLL